MGFMDRIAAKKCFFLEWIENYYGQKVILFGAGEGAQNIYRYLESVEIPVAHIVENRDYFISGKMFMGRNIEILEDVLEAADEKVDLIIEITGYQPFMIHGYDRKVNQVLFYDLPPALLSDRGKLSTTPYEFWAEKEEVLNKIYSSMNDKFSKECMVSYVNQRISGDYSYSDGMIKSTQYFDDELIWFSDNEVFVDCGAFDGQDTIEFLKRAKGDHNKVIIFEPDEQNGKVISERLGEEDACCLIKKAAWSSDGMLKFMMGNATESRVVENGDTDIPCAKIDSICDKMQIIPTFIKMDIEGSELEALHGAEEMIRKYKPKLAISIYHRPEDLILIWDYIQNVRQDYKFGFRRYSRSFRETVMFAI